MANQLPRDVLSLPKWAQPKWAQSLLNHLLSVPDDHGPPPYVVQ